MDKLLIKVAKDSRIRDEMGNGKLLWSHWMKLLNIKVGDIGYLTFTPCEPSVFKDYTESLKYQASKLEGDK